MDKSINKTEVMSYFATKSVRSPGRKKLFQLSKIKFFGLWVCHYAPNRIYYFGFPRFPEISDNLESHSPKNAEVWGLEKEENYCKYV